MSGYSSVSGAVAPFFALKGGENEMTNREIEKHKKDYLHWLYFDILDGPEGHFNAFKSLFKTLLSIPYRWVHPMDENRCKDGLAMREDYCSDYGYEIDDILGDCSVLEMLIALSYRIEKEIMAPAVGKFDCFRWFWGMIEHLELDDFDENGYDEGWIYSIIDRFLDRKYDENGENGGLFPLHFCKKAAYEMEIWDQMNEYLVENWV